MTPSSAAKSTSQSEKSCWAVRAVGVSKRYSRGNQIVPALRSIDLSLRRSSLVAVMGPSGCGKSTLLHLLAGLTQPDAGQILVDDVNLATLDDEALTRFRRNHIGLVFQSFNLIPALTAEQNILLPLAAGGQGADAGPRLEALLERLDLAGRRHHRPDALSGGEQQRVAIARALITDPAIVLADEPTGCLDSTTGQEVCRLLRELCQQQGRTILIVTHEASVAAWSQSVLVMNDGRLCGQFSTAAEPDPLAVSRGYHELIQHTGETCHGSSLTPPVQSGAAG